MSRRVPCTYCGRTYRPVWTGDERKSCPTQGVRCASLVVEQDGEARVLGCYGSDHDLTLFRVFTGELPVGLDPLCDDCIDSFVAEGSLQRLGDCDLDGNLYGSEAEKKRTAEIGALVKLFRKEGYE